MGASGVACMEETLAEARRLGYVVILNTKHGDIGATAAAYFREFLARREELDYLGTDYSRMPRGTDAEAFSFSALERAWREGKGPLDREHVTWYIHKNPDRFKTAFHSVGEDMSRYRLTVDIPAL